MHIHRNKHIYQVVPYASTSEDKPPRHKLAWEDEDGITHYGDCWYVGRIHRSSTVRNSNYGELMESKGRMIRNGIVDDLEELGVDEEKVSSIMRYANDVAKKNPYQPEAYIEAIKQDLELEGIKYDMSFWENYISKILELSTKAEPRFAGGGLV